MFITGVALFERDNQQENIDASLPAIGGNTQHQLVPACSVSNVELDS
jgi:hypothetical protein